MKIQEFFDPATYTLTYVVFDEATRDSVVIDPVMDYDPASSKVSFQSVEKICHFLSSRDLKLHYILETHAHADHMSGAQRLLAKYPKAKLAIGAHIRKVQQLFKGIFNLAEDFRIDGSQFDQLLDDGEVISAGTLSIKTIYTPGHTPACASYLIGDAVFTGDVLFMPDHGTGRCDFPAGSASDLYDSIMNRLYKLPDSTRVFVGHDYQTGRESLLFESTISAEKRENIQLRADTTKEGFVAARNNRDKNLAAPRLLLPSIQINIDGGRLPKSENNGMRYLKIPLREAGG